MLVFIVCDGIFAQTPPSGKRLWGSVELGIAPAIVDVNLDHDEDYMPSTIGINAFGGIYISSAFSMGAGTGISYFDGPGIFYTPVWGEIKYRSPLKRRENTDLFIYARGGYPFLPGEKRGGGSLAGAGFGFTLDTSQKPKYNVSAGYAFTHLDYTTKGGPSHSPSRHAVELRFGLFW